MRGVRGETQMVLVDLIKNPTIDNGLVAAQVRNFLLSPAARNDTLVQLQRVPAIDWWLLCCHLVRIWDQCTGVLQPGDGQQNNGPMPPINAFYSLLKLSKWECSSIQKRLLKLCWKVKRKGNIFICTASLLPLLYTGPGNIVADCERDITHHI